MSASDVVEVMKSLLAYCLPCAFIINLTAYAVSVVVSVATGKGLKL